MDLGAERPARRWLRASYIALTGALVAYALTALTPGNPTAAAEVAGHFAATLAGATCLGGLIFILVSARPDERGVIDAGAFRAHLLIERASLVWLAVAAAMVVVQAATDAGVSLLRLLSSGLIGSALGASETARGWVVVTLCAAALTVGVRLTLRWDWHVPLVIPAIVGVLAVPVTGNAGQGPDHDYATGAVIVFAIAIAALAGLKIAGASAPKSATSRTSTPASSTSRTSAPKSATSRTVRIATVTAGALTLIYGAGLLVLLAGPPWSSGYGGLGLLAGAAVIAGVILDLRRRAPVISALTAVVALAAVSAMAVQTAPRLLATQPTVWDILLGYELPGPPTAARLMTFWRFDTFLGVAAVALAALYIAGVVRLRRRGDRWPVGRLVAWLAGCLAMLLATSSGIRSYGSAMFSVHMVEHMTLNMFTPVMLVLGAPVTLALRSLGSAGPGAPPGPREWILRFVHSPLTGVLSHPVTAFVLFVGSLYAVYFTPLFDTLVRYHWGHELMSVHFLLTGYLFYWGIIGIDPGPRRLPFIGRLALLFAVMPFHAFFGIATMTMNSAIGETFYRGLALPWVPSLTDDQHLGGAIAWGSSEVPLVMVVIALVTQWARQDRRTSTRSDRHSDAGFDDDMDAYNNMLRELARGRS